MKTEVPVVNLGRFELRDICEADYLDYFIIGSDAETCKHLNWGPFIKPIEAKKCNNWYSSC